VSEDESVVSRPAPPPALTARYGTDPENVIDVWAGDARRPLVVFLHGGFWRPAHDRLHTYPLANALLAGGWPVASVEFRRNPGEPRHTTDDVATALATPVPVPHEGIVLAGHSAGGHLALWAAVAAAPADLIGTLALAPVADLRLAENLGLGGGAVAAFLGAAAEEFGSLDPVRLRAPAQPTVLVHGADDQVVPLTVARSYHARHPGTGLVVLLETGHFALIDPRSAAWPAVLAELRALVG
jgi:acetyl esterase/lipase